MTDEEKYYCVGATILIFMISLIIYAILEGDSEWEKFKVEHHCEIVAKNSGGMGIGLGSNGQVGMISLPNSTSYLCADGITYTR